MAELEYAIDSKSIALTGLWVQLPPPAPYMLNKLINPDKKLRAYIIGLALGDGNLSNPNGRGIRLRISCDCKYPLLIEKIQKSVQLLLPNNIVSLKKTQNKNCIEISCYSNLWPEILGWKTLGSKYRQLSDVPDWVKNNKQYSINCLRGLIETDGSIYTDRNYLTVMFVSIIPNLAQSFYDMVTALGFKPHMYEIIPKSKWNSKKIYHIRISKRVKEFIKLIKPEKK